MDVSSEHGDYLLWSKSQVYVRTNNDRENGYFGILKRVSRDTNTSDRFFLTWVSEVEPKSLISVFQQAEKNVSRDNEDDFSSKPAIVDVTDQLADKKVSQSASFKQDSPSINFEFKKVNINLYSINSFLVALSDIRLITLRAPVSTSKHGSMFITLKNDSTCARLFFDDDNCPSTVKERKYRAKNFIVPNHGEFFWGGLHSVLALKHVVRIEKSGKFQYLVDPSASNSSNFDEVELDDKPGRKFRTDLGKSIKAAVSDAKWTLLERFSRLTKIGKQAAYDILSTDALKDVLPVLPPKVKEIITSSLVQEIIHEYDPARLYLARWATMVAKQSNLDVSDSERNFDNLQISDFAKFKIQEVKRTPPIGLDSWNCFFDKEGNTILSSMEIREKIFEGCVEPQVRKVAWKFLLNFWIWDSNTLERVEMTQQKRESYYMLKMKWKDDYNYQKTDQNFKLQKLRIEKDVHRTDRNIDLFSIDDLPHPDRKKGLYEKTNIHMENCKDILLTYNEFKPKLEYVQGMADLLSPIYYVMQNEADAFWCFCSLMEDMQVNFYTDQTGMSFQLETLSKLVELMDPDLSRHLKKCDSLNYFFAYRMLLIRFKRDFKWENMLKLWDVLFSNYFTKHFHIFVALAIIETERDTLIANFQEFDEVLRYFNDLSYNIDLNIILKGSEKLYYKFRQVVSIVDQYKSKQNNDNYTSNDISNKTIDISPQLRFLLD